MGGAASTVTEKFVNAPRVVWALAGFVMMIGGWFVDTTRNVFPRMGAAGPTGGMGGVARSAKVVLGSQGVTFPVHAPAVKLAEFVGEIGKEGFAEKPTL